ncbi:MAG: hypothetical protein R3246_14535 [Acidimicrobiia bacterium]|nr:hypothetical protein [Acidimicrobiia bacterium]
MAGLLLIADDEWVQNDVAAALADPSLTLEIESDPRAAVARASEERFAWAIVDLQVGSMGGMAVVRALRNAIAAGQIEDMGLILLLDRDADRFIAKRAGVDAAVVKPFTAQQLRACLTQAV